MRLTFYAHIINKLKSPKIFCLLFNFSDYFFLGPHSWEVLQLSHHHRNRTTPAVVSALAKTVITLATTTMTLVAETAR